MRSDGLNQSSGKYGLNQIRQIIYSQDVGSTIELAPEQSGALVLLRNCGAAKLINLPDASDNDGVWYDFYLHETLSAHTTTIQSQDGTDYFLGTVADGEGDGTSGVTTEVAFNGSSHDQLVVAASATAGEFEMRLVCDGSNWLIMHGISQDISDISQGTGSSNT